VDLERQESNGIDAYCMRSFYSQASISDIRVPRLVLHRSHSSTLRYGYSQTSEFSHDQCVGIAQLTIHFPQLTEYNESPLFLQLSPGSSSLARAKAGGELPIAIYETHMEMPDAQSSSATSGPTMFFRPASYHVETGEAERIAVDHTSKPPEADGDAQSSLIANLTTQYNAIKMLSDRIDMVQEYVHAVQSQKVPQDQEILRQIASLVAGLPASGELEEFRQEFLTEYNDLLLTSYLADLTTGLSSLNEVCVQVKQKRGLVQCLTCCALNLTARGHI
jgi:hypothetical protein